jgi:hypothetical protein
MHASIRVQTASGSNEKLAMTMPEERTKAVVETRQFLEMLRSSESEITWGLVRTMASQLLRHYPLDVDLSVSASALPGVWAPPRDSQS